MELCKFLKYNNQELMVLSALGRDIFSINSAIHQTSQWLDKYKPLTSRASSFVIVHWPKSPYSSSKSVVLHPKHSLIAGKSMKSTALDRIDCYGVRSVQISCKIAISFHQKTSQRARIYLISMLSKWRDAMLKTMTEIVKQDQRWSSNRRPYLFVLAGK